MNKGGGLGSIAKGMGSKMGKLKNITDKGKELAGKASDVSNKVGKLGEKAKSLESSVKDKVNLSDKKDSLTSNLSSGISKLKDMDENMADKQAKGRITDELLDGKSVVNKYGMFGPVTYKYLIYVILFLNICSIILLTFNKSVFYKYNGNTEVDVRLNKNVFYIYIFTLFLFILQLYTLKENYNDIVEQRGKYQIYFEIFNVLCTIGLTYYIYTQIDFIHTDCPEPNKRVCVANKYGPNDISQCINGPYRCGKIEETEYNCRKDNCDSDISKNFYFVPPPPPDPVYTCKNYNASNCTDGKVLKDEPENQICNGSECTVDECCISPSEKSAVMTSEKLKKLITDNFKDLIKDDEGRITALEDRIKNLSPSEGIPGPPGPPGPPGADGIAGATGTPGSDARPPVPPSNQYKNILCPNEPGGVCKDGQTRCNDKGMCEGFSLITLKDKMDLKLKYKDLNSNAYKVNNLMNNLETFLLNTLK